MINDSIAIDAFGTYRPNWLGSEVGLTLKSVTLKGTTAHEIINNRRIVVSGTYYSFTNNEGHVLKGLIFQDIDITDGDVSAPLLVGGRYLSRKLPKPLTAQNKTDFIAQGLFEFDESRVVRPDFGITDYGRLAAPVVTFDLGVMTWTAVPNALSYDIFRNGFMLRNVTATTFTPTTVGRFEVVAVGDNLVYQTSLRSNPITVTTIS